MFTRTSYGDPKAPYQLLITCPHGANHQLFMEKFPEVANHPKIKACYQTFERYLRIERDYGAAELAHGLATEVLAIQPGSHIEVFEHGFPRGIVDGGRLPDWSLRSCLPADLAIKLKQRLQNLHHEAYEQVCQLAQTYHQLGGYVVDMHTMAPLSPVDAQGQAVTQAVSFDNLESYVQQFTQPSHQKRRFLDLITGDGSGQLLADPGLVAALKVQLSKAGYEWVENDPYAAPPHFLMNRLMSLCQGIAIDVPKDMVAVCEQNLDDFDLERFAIDDAKVKQLSQSFAQGLVLKTS